MHLSRQATSKQQKESVSLVVKVCINQLELISRLQVLIAYTYKAMHVRSMDFHIELECFAFIVRKHDQTAKLTCPGDIHDNLHGDFRYIR